MASVRIASPQEIRLLNLLAERAFIGLPVGWEHTILVKPMDDGGMGSLQLLPAGCDEKVRQFDKRVSDYRFNDDDGVDVLASLNVDKEGDLLEIDMWKTDYSSLIQYPSELR